MRNQTILANSGVSNVKGFTPQRQDLPPSDVSQKIACAVIGPGYDRPTTLYVLPKKLGLVRDKYKALGLTLLMPNWAQQKYAEILAMPAGVEVVPDVEPAPFVPPVRKATARPIICLNTGRHFQSAADVVSRYGFQASNLNAHLRGKSKTCRGRKLRYATPEEIHQMDTVPDWRYDGEFIPLSTL